ncbi:hypothetical protein [Sulfuricella sp.]|uniref:hypothetical protein n=1 Tax=Sulfuricella sp. TaxID=2099377 RepID=UPI002BB2CDEE|nr:hypothetical protein [Sulfuricella sp.]HUX62783.1 hypothetical protein [Sulfuricella sp.]
MGLELRQLTQAELLGAMARQLGVDDSASQEGGLSTALIAAVLRRIAGATCPCSRDTVVGIATDALCGFVEAEALRVRVREVLNSLVVIGDLLELGGTSSLPSVAAGDWLYCAPPTFVVQDGSVLILGIESEDQSAMPLALRQQVQCPRELRIIRTEDSAAIREQLLVAGYLEISKVAWTRLPLERTARKFLDEAIQRLKESGGRGELEGLKVLGPGNGSKNFVSRWIPPNGQSGHFVGRRPQAFGSPIWVFVELDQGRPKSFIDLPWRGAKFRGCDHGWRIQSALDALSCNPQTYRVVSRDDGVDRYEFFSPLPLWVERRLRIHGQRVSASGALIAYKLEHQSDHGIDDLLQSHMWFKQVKQGE